MAIISQIRCPKCHSLNLYRFGKDIHGHQKFQCKECKRQFTLYPSSFKHKDYPRCPKCGKATFIHHDYKFYTNYRCGDKSCYHSFSVIKLENIKPTSSESLLGKLSFTRMRFKLHTILTALNLYFVCNSSTRQISSFLLQTQNIKVSHVTISKWVIKFAPMFDVIKESFMPSVDLNSDEWHADETVVKISGRRYYIWFIVDSETRFVIAFHLSPYRDHTQAFSLFNKARKLGKPMSVVTDRLGSYNVAARNIFGSSCHIKVESFKADISNNLIESFNGSFKDFYRSKKGFASYSSANNIISTFVFFYNFVRNHSSLNGLTPAMVAGANYSERSRRNWLLI